MPFFATPLSPTSPHPKSVYNTFRVPFTKSLCITAQLPERIKDDHLSWVDIRGLEGMPIAIGSALQLPPTQYRMRLYRNTYTNVPRYHYFSLLNTTRSGLV